MDDLLSPLARLLGRILGKAADCGLDCPVSEFGWAEYALLGVALFAAFFGTRAVITRMKKRG